MSSNTVITFSGYPGSGTTTLASALNDWDSTTYINGGQIFRTLADSHDMTLSEFSTYVNSHPEIDKKIDETLYNIVTAYKTDKTKPNITDLPIELSIDFSSRYLILESRLAGWIAGENAGVKFWIHAPLKTRVTRRDNESLRSLKQRQTDEIQRYKDWYNIDLTDQSIYDFSLNTANWRQKHLIEFIETAITCYDSTTTEGAYSITPSFIDRL